MTTTGQDARAKIRAAIKTTHGGVYRAALAAGVHYTQVYSFLRGGRLRTDNAGRLRAVLPEVAPEVWADAFAPLGDVVDL